MLTSVEGVCRNGKIELKEPLPAGVEGRVIVTFLSSPSVELTERGISVEQAVDLRGRLSSFADDWTDPAMDSYDGV